MAVSGNRIMVFVKLHDKYRKTIPVNKFCDISQILHMKFLS